jgi:hypothetical protein
VFRPLFDKFDDAYQVVVNDSRSSPLVLPVSQRLKPDSRAAPLN